MIFLGFRGGRASPPKRGLGSLFRFVLPAIEQIRSNPVTSTRLRNIPALNTFLHHLPFLFRGTIYAWFSAHVASCFGGPDFTQLKRLVLAGSTTASSLLALSAFALYCGQHSGGVLHSRGFQIVPFQSNV